MLKRASYEILGLPSNAALEEVRAKYFELAYKWCPARNHNSTVSIQHFLNSTRALLGFYPKPVDISKSLDTMYAFFQLIFFGNTTSIEQDCNSCEEFSDDLESADEFENQVKKINEANHLAEELILEEEKEKEKANKKKARKKKRKEKKRPAHGKDASEKECVASSDSEEDIDPDSAFVRKKYVVKKREGKSAQEQQEAKSKELRSSELTIRGNQMVKLGQLAEAVELFSESIRLNPINYRLYNNRSYCYERLGHFERALRDANRSVALCLNSSVGYYRKGRALLGLKRYSEAQDFFERALSLDKKCDDVVQEIHNLKLIQIMEKGYSKEQAQNALKYCPTVPECLTHLLTTTHSPEGDIFFSDSPKEYDIKTDPHNPEGHHSIWVGNVMPAITEKKLKGLFGKIGEMLSVRVVREKSYAFVNYKSKVSAGKAMQAYQGLELGGSNLVIRYPNQPGEKPKPASQAKPVNGDECYFWRTNGACTHGDKCRFKHLKAHKAIDKK